MIKSQNKYKKSNFNKRINLGDNFNKIKSKDCNSKSLISKKVNEKIIIKKLKETYNAMEMNSFNYEEALLIDRRTYCQYYLSLLKTKHILFFSFCYHGDFNSQMIKLYIFFFTFE